MKHLPIKINKFEIQKTDNKLDFFENIIDNTITAKCDKLYEEAQKHCSENCTKTFEICDEILGMNPLYISAHLKKIRCIKRIDNSQRVHECEDLLKRFPNHNIKIEFLKLMILNNMDNVNINLALLLDKLSTLSDTEIGDNFEELGYGFAKINNHNLVIKFYSKHIERNPLADFAFEIRGIAYENLGDYKNAIVDFKKSIELLLISLRNDKQERLDRCQRRLMRAQDLLTSTDNLPF